MWRRLEATCGVLKERTTLKERESVVVEGMER